MFDLTIFPLTFDTGREQYELPGLLVASAPRRAARMRSRDTLILYAHLVQLPSNREALTASQRAEVLSRLAETYFTTTGSVTAGLRAVIHRLNEFLLSRNLKKDKEGQFVGTLNLAVLHGTVLLVGHAGPTHSFFLTRSQVQHFDDGQGGRKLGLSRQPSARFYQTAVEPGDLLLLCSEPPSTWNEKHLSSSPQVSLDHMRRRLLNDHSVNFQSALVRFQPGKGQVSYWRPGERGAAPAPLRTQAAAPADTRAVDRVEDKGHPAPRPDIPLPGQPADEPLPESEPIVSEPPAFEPVSSQPAVSEPPFDRPEPDTDLADHRIAFTNEPGPGFPEPGFDEAVFVSESPADWAPASEPAASPFDTTPREVVFLNNETAAPEPPAPFSPRPPRPGGEPRTRPAAAAPEQQAAPDQPAGEPSQPRHPSRAAGANKPAVKKPLAKKSLAQAARPKTPRISLVEQLRRRLARPWRKGAQTREKVSRTVSGVSARVIPPATFAFSPARMLSVAILIPLMVVTMGTLVYFRIGHGEQFQIYFDQAQAYAQQVAAQTDPAQQREGWTRTYEMINLAEKYGQTEESRALKKEVIAALDSLEGFVRLTYQPAVRGGFSSDVNITHMVATLYDVFLLDSAQGRILHLIMTSSGYDIDTRFNCGAGKAGTQMVGPLVDLALLPPGNEMRALVMGIDGQGNLVYCSSNTDGFDSQPLPQPDNGWKGITAMTTKGDTLYVLDPLGNAVYYFDGQNGLFEANPHLYFDDSIPQMSDVIDLAVDQEFLYLLHQDGRMTVCESAGFSYSHTKCQDPMPYGDPRSGYEASPLAFAGAHFTEVQTTEPPDPSIYALDDQNASVYHLSLRRLNYQRQYRPMPDSDFPLPPGAPTAFVIAPNHRVLLAFGNQLYFALIQ